MSAFFELERFFLLHFSVVFSTWIYKLFIWSKLTLTVTVIRYSSDLEYIDTLVISFWHVFGDFFFFECPRDLFWTGSKFFPSFQNRLLLGSSNFAGSSECFS